MEIDQLTADQINELVRLASAFKAKLKEFDVDSYVDILGVEANRGGRCFLSGSLEEGTDVSPD